MLHLLAPAFFASASARSRLANKRQDGYLPAACFSRIIFAWSSFVRANSVPDWVFFFLEAAAALLVFSRAFSRWLPRDILSGWMNRLWIEWVDGLVLVMELARRVLGGAALIACRF